MHTRKTLKKLSTLAALTCAASLAVPASAQAQATDAVRGCGAYDVTDTAATVPANVRDFELFHVDTDEGRFPIRCGNGASSGAVHIEVKHKVPDWADALSCITKAIRGSFSLPNYETGKTTNRYMFDGGTVVVVRGNDGVITAYPTRGGREQKWRACSTS